MSRRTVTTTATFSCTPCGVIKKGLVHVGDEPTMLCECGQPFHVTVQGHRPHSLFPFVSDNIDGKGTPITVESLHHARALERQYGIKFTAFSDHQSKWNDWDDKRDLPTFRGYHGHYDNPDAWK